MCLSRNEDSPNHDLLSIAASAIQAEAGRSPMKRNEYDTYKVRIR
jgi:hypothetical protein